MGLFSGIGHFLGNIFGGDQTDEEKKRQQQLKSYQAPQKVVPFGSVSQRPDPGTIFTPTPPPDNGLNLFNGQLQKAPLVKPVPVVGPPKAPLPDEQFKAISEGEAKNKTIFGKNAAWLLPKSLEKTHAVKADRSITTNQDKYVAEYDKLHPDYQKVLVNNAKEQAKNGDQAAANTLRALKDSGRLGGNFNDFAEGFNDKLAGGLGRATLRTTDLLLPGHNTFGLEKAADQFDPSKNKTQQITSAGRAGETSGTVAKGAVDVASIVLPQSNIDKLAEANKAYQALKDGTKLMKVGGKLIKVVPGSLAGTGIDYLEQRGRGDNPNLLQSAGIGTGLDIAADSLPGGIGKLRKFLRRGTGGTQVAENLVEQGVGVATAGGTAAVRNIDNAAEEAARVAKTEIAPGVSSVNPTREADAVKQVVEQTPPPVAPPSELQKAATDINTPAYQRTQLKDQLAKEEAANTAAKADELGAGPSNLDRPTFQHKDDIQAVIDQGQRELDDFINANPGATTQEIEAAQGSIKTQVIDRVQRLQENRAGGVIAPPVSAAPDVPVDVPAAAVPETPVRPPAAVVDTATPVVPEPTAAPISTVPTVPVEPVVQAPPIIPASAIPEPLAATADVAPRTHDALSQQLGDIGQELKGKYGKRVPLDLEDLKTNAKGVIANMTDEDLLKAFATADPSSMVNSPQEFGLARAAIERLSKVDGNAQADQTVKNILDAMATYESKSGQGLRVVQEEFDNMPLPMKTRYIIKNIDNANKAVEGYARLADDPAKAAVVEANINGFLKGSEAINERVSALQGQLNAVADAARNGEKANVDVKGIVKQLKNEQLALAANNGELVKYYTELVPGRTKGQRVLNDFPRQMMLSSGTGRLQDLITTGANVANLSVQNTLHAGLAKAINFFSPGKVTDTSRGAGKIFTGAAEGLRKTAGEIRGTQYTDNLEGALRANVDQRSGLQKAKGPIGRTIQAATEAATNISEGVKGQRLYQLADQEAAQLGLKGAARRTYAEARAAVPTRQMEEAASQLHKEVNNLNENRVSQTLNRIAAGIEGKSAVGGFLKNQVMPFTSWLGGNIYNSITDKNVIASTVKILDSVRKGDVEGIVRNVSKLGTNAAQTYALGYQLTKHGLITNQNAEGYNDAGAYLHIGDRYIPVGFLGFAAPSIVLGNATYNAVNNPDGGSAVDRLLKGAEQSIFNMAKSINVAGALGTENNLSRSYDELTKPGGGPADAAATFASGAAGQFIPALSGDVNAVLNNGLKVGDTTIIPDTLNPTHEKANTKVVDPNSPSGQAKDVPKSAVQSLKNRIPGLSQTLPRKAGTAAPDLIDRTTKGGRDTTAGIEARTNATAKVDQTKDFQARNIPDPNTSKFDDAVKARIEDGNYDAAIEGLTAKLENNKKDSNIPKSTNAKIETQVKQLQVTKKGGFSPAIIDAYNKTSLTEWRDMGDPESDAYDPTTYNNLWRYDSALADAGVSRNNTKADNTFYSPKKPGKGRKGNSAEDIRLAKIKSNTVGSTPNLNKISFGNLAPEKITNAKIPTIQNIKAGDLIKQRKISVGKAY